ncbi:MAG: hypothetical protein ACTSYI_06750 [Promethearchaeota archaeon]
MLDKKIKKPRKKPRTGKKKLMGMITYKNLIVIPTYHDSLDFTYEVRRIFSQNIPDIIAVEFPDNLKTKILQGIKRIPKISVVLYFDEYLQKQLYIPINPADSLIEGLRLAEEYGIPTEFIDLFIKNYDPPIMATPDSYVLNYMSLDDLYSLMNEHLGFKKYAKQRYQENILKEREVFEKSIQNMDELESSSVDTPAIGEDAEQWMQSSQNLDDLRNLYMASRLNELMRENPDSTILAIIGMNHWESVRLILEKDVANPDLTSFSTEIQSEIFNIRQEDIPKLILETPNICFQYELFRQQQKLQWDDDELPEGRKFLFKKFEVFSGFKNIYTGAIERYQLEYDETISLHKLKSLYQFLRNLPLVQDRIKPNLFEIVLAAKSIINDDFAWIVWEEAIFYPFSEDPAEIPTLDLTNRGIFLHGKYFTLRRSIPMKLNQLKLPLKERPKEKKEGDWRKEWNKGRWSLVSHLPEDIYEENYFQHIRERTLAILKDDFVKIHKFSSTLMDGIDFRETIRNWPINHEIYIREEIAIKGSVDCVVIIFDEDSGLDEKFPYEMNWYAEHPKESDLAFYSTYPGVILVGPGISRIELGGVASFFPPRGIPNIWAKEFKEDYSFIETKSERLLLAALLFAQKNLVTYVAMVKPRQIFYSIAAKFNIKIIFLPLSRFNPESLRNLRNLHILAGKDRRNIAHKYIHKKKS